MTEYDTYYTLVEPRKLYGQTYICSVCSVGVLYVYLGKHLDWHTNRGDINED